MFISEIILIFVFMKRRGENFLFLLFAFVFSLFLFKGKFSEEVFDVYYLIGSFILIRDGIKTLNKC